MLVDLCSLEFDRQCLHRLVVTLDGIIQSLGSFLLLTVDGFWCLMAAAGGCCCLVKAQAAGVG